MQQVYDFVKESQGHSRGYDTKYSYAFDLQYPKVKFYVSNKTERTFSPKLPAKASSMNIWAILRNLLKFYLVLTSLIWCLIQFGQV